PLGWTQPHIPPTARLALRACAGERWAPLDSPAVPPVAREVVNVDGLRMHYLRAGDGPALVLLHGWPQTGHCWRHLIEPLAERHTVLVPDVRGYGLTDKPLGGYDKRTMASDVRALVREAGFDEVTLVGHDRGGRVAHRYALDHPEEVARLVVVDIIPS